MIEREFVIHKIRPFMDKPIIKVLTGIRRCGKSVMLELIQNELILKGISKEQMLVYNFEDLELDYLLTAKALHTDVIAKMAKPVEKYYLFFDEIQEVESWERCINSLLSIQNIDIYITGSNAKLLSGELATYLSGRYVEISMHPFSFSEFLSLYGYDAKSPFVAQYFRDYIELGGFPFIKYFNEDKSAVSQYLKDIYASVLIKDVLKRNRFRDVELLERILLYVIAHIGESFSATSISKFFKSENRMVAPETILNQLRACEEAFLLHRVSRIDLVGKMILQTNEKFYISDHGLREAMYGHNQRDVGRVLENIVYMEMLRRGYTVHVGKIDDFEVDFVCEKANQRIYIQVAYLLASEDTIKREFGSLLKIQDNYPKYVLSMDTLDLSREGIVHQYLPQFLLEMNV
jgi:hypothetical protein